jgi:NADH-quinone oxidoreductase subunit B
VPGCPPRPEALAHGILKLRDKVQGNDREGWRERYGAVGTEEVVPDPADSAGGTLSISHVPGDRNGA